MELYIIDPSHKRYKDVLNFIKIKYDKRYHGWNNEFDSKFNDQTKCFYIEEDGEIVATSRLVFNKQDGKNSLSPAFGIVKNWNLEDYKFDCEGSALCFNLGYLQPLMLSMFTWLDRKEMGNCLSLYDPGNSQVTNYNQNILQFEPIKEDATVSFEKFTGKDDDIPVEWKVGRQTPKARKRCIEILKGHILQPHHMDIPVP